jgi:pimeloyl-ACP methyl ester carboxylesterase
MSGIRLAPGFAGVLGLLVFSTTYASAVGPAAASIGQLPCSSEVAAPSAHCFRILVPENYRVPNGTKIQLDAFVLRAHTPGSRRAVFVLDGGPGERATRDFSEADLTGLATTADVVVVDQRGTGTTPDIRCQNDTSTANLPTLMIEMWPVGGLQSCLQGLHGTVDLTQYTTRNTVEDIEQARQLLGYQKIDIVGYSFGTRLAQEYMRRHGANVRSVVLSGPLSPEVAMPEGVARHAEASLQAVIDRCIDDASCRESYPDLRGDLAKLERKLDAQTMTVSVSDQQLHLGRGVVGSYIRSLLYRSEAAADVPYTIHVLASEHPDVSAQKIVAWRVAMERAGAWGLYFSITCTEDFPLNSLTALKRDARNTLLGDYRVEQLRAACAVWPHGEIPAELHKSLSSDIPTLVLSGVADPITPPVYGEHIVEHLRNGRLVRLPNGAHINNSDCVERIMLQFVNTADAAKTDISCLGALRFPPFKALSAAAG